MLYSHLSPHLKYIAANLVKTKKKEIYANCMVYTTKQKYENISLFVKI